MHRHNRVAVLLVVLTAMTCWSGCDDVPTAQPPATVSAPARRPTEPGQLAADPSSTPAYERAVQELRLFLVVWQHSGLREASDVLVPRERPAPCARVPTLRSWAVARTSPARWFSVRRFTMRVVLRLRLAGHGDRLWHRGVDRRLVTFTWRPTAATYELAVRRARSTASAPRKPAPHLGSFLGSEPRRVLNLGNRHPSR